MKDLLNEEKEFIESFDKAEINPEFHQNLENKILTLNDHNDISTVKTTKIPLTYKLSFSFMSLAIICLCFVNVIAVFNNLVQPKIIDSNFAIMNKVYAANDIFPFDPSTTDLNQLQYGPNTYFNYYYNKYVVKEYNIAKTCEPDPIKRSVQTFTWINQIYRDQDNFYSTKFQALGKNDNLEFYNLVTKAKTYTAYPTENDFADVYDTKDNSTFWEEDPGSIQQYFNLKYKLTYYGEEEVDGIKYHVVELKDSSKCFDNNKKEKTFNSVKHYYARQSDFVVDRLIEYEQSVSKDNVLIHSIFNTKRLWLDEFTAQNIFKYDLNLKLQQK